jgi:hypothetical protein
VTISRLSPCCRVESELRSEAAHSCAMPLDHYLAGMVAASEMMGEVAPLRPVDPRLLAAGVAIFLALLAYAGPVYAADPAMVGKVKCLAIAEGVVKPPKRASADERCKAAAARLGFVNGKAVRS